MVVVATFPPAAGAEDTLEYLRSTELASTLNRVVNKVLKERPADPYGRIAQLVAEAAPLGSGAPRGAEAEAEGTRASVRQMSSSLNATRDVGPKDSRSEDAASLRAELDATAERVALPHAPTLPRRPRRPYPPRRP